MTLHAGLYASTSRGAPPLLNSLTHVEVRKMDARSLLLFGLQFDPYAPKPLVDYKQAWFCQPVRT